MRTLKVNTIRVFVSIAAIISLSSATLRAAPEDYVRSGLDKLQQTIPREARGFRELSTTEVEKAALECRERIAAFSVVDHLRSSAQVLDRVDQMATVKDRVDKLLAALFEIRLELASWEPGEPRATALSHYLQTTKDLIDLSGRVNFFYSSTVRSAAANFSSRPNVRDQLIDLLLKRKSALGAEAISMVLLDPPANSPDGAKPASAATKAKLLKLFAETGSIGCYPATADYLLFGNPPPALAILAAETIEVLGLPQEDRNFNNTAKPRNERAPVMSAKTLHDLLVKSDASQLSPELKTRREKLISRMAARAKDGLAEDRYPMGNFDIQPGDWLLTRNPSPYNVTTLSPILFSHVGVATSEVGKDGKRRIVAVEMRERGTRIPATNIEVFLSRTLHYVILRHSDPKVRAAMGDVARSIIGNEMEFDLDFETTRVQKLRGKSLEGKKIKTYCAGLLLLCAQATSQPREEFFPIAEGPRGDQTAANLKKLGIKLGKDFVSPTGPIFAQNMKIVARREAMYHSVREIEQAVFNRFGERIAVEAMTPTNDLFQNLRLRMARMANGNPLLAKALAATAGVSDQIDLVSAAKAVAAVETLDEIAYGSSRDYRLAFTAVVGGPLEALKQYGYSPLEIKRIGELRKRHADLRSRVDKLSDRQLRLELVEYYIAHGRKRIDQRFFAAE